MSTPPDIATPTPSTRCSVRSSPRRGPRSPTDGRIERSRRTRQAIVDGFIALAGQWGRPPSVQELGARAGCSIRTVFDRFDSLDALASTAVHQLLTPLTHDQLHLVAGVERSGRIAFLVESRKRSREALRRLWPIVVEVTRRDPACAAQLEVFTGFDRAQAEVIFAPELRLLADVERAELLLALEVLLGIETWISLRERHRLPMGQAAEFWRSSVERLLA